MRKKIINSAKLLSGYTLSRVSRKALHWGTPFSISIEPTNYCNLHCPECPSGMNHLTRSKGTMDLDLYKTLIDQLSPALFYLNLSFQGEPYLHTQFAEMVRYAKLKKIYVSASTNGHFLSPENVRKTIESGLDRLIISLDGMDADTYRQYRVGGNFTEVIRGITEIVEQKKATGSTTPKIILQFLILKSNQYQVKNIRKFGKYLGVDKVELKTAQFIEFKNGNPLMPRDRYSRYKKIITECEDKPRYEIRNRMSDHCFRLWTTSVVTWDGFVVPCCFDKDATYKMGNLNEQPFMEIWKNEGYRNFRKKILSCRKSIDICNNCI